jgi:hypothetical protein
MSEAYLAYINHTPRLFKIRENAEKFVCEKEYVYLKKHLERETKFDAGEYGSRNPYRLDNYNSAIKFLDDIYNSNVSWEAKRKMFNEDKIPIRREQCKCPENSDGTKRCGSKINTECFVEDYVGLGSLALWNNCPRFEVEPIAFEDDVDNENKIQLSEEEEDDMY